MRSVRLLRLAAQAEQLRLRRWARRQAGRAVLAAVAAVFCVAALAGLHIAAVLALTEHMTPMQAVLIVAGVDVVVAVVVAALAARDVPGTVERQALELRRTVVAQAVDNVIWLALLRGLRDARSLRDLGRLLAGVLAEWLARGRS